MQPIHLNSNKYVITWHASLRRSERMMSVRLSEILPISVIDTMNQKLQYEWVRKQGQVSTGYTVTLLWHLLSCSSCIEITKILCGQLNEGGYLEVSHCRASVGSATSGWDKGARQSHQAYPAEGKGGITHWKDHTNTRLNRDGGYKLPGCWVTTMKKPG